MKNDGLKLKAGCSFSFGGQIWRGGTKRDTVPAKVLSAIEKDKKNSKHLLDKLNKLKFVEKKEESEVQKEPVKKEDGKSKGKS